MLKPEEIHKILSSNVKNQRKKLKYSQEKLAELAGLSVQTINDIEGCRKWVSARTITKLAGALDMECYHLLMPGFISQNKKQGSPTKNLLMLKEKLNNGIDTLIETQFSDFINIGLHK
jgi:transcriptional regulator with XRE-family HTH domain